MKSKKSKNDTPLYIRIFDAIYLFVIIFIFAAVLVCMLVMPRSTVSVLEKRKLTEFPKLTADSYISGDFTSQLSAYFSDTVPLRDKLTTLSAALTDKEGISTGVKLHGVTAKVDGGDAVNAAADADSKKSDLQAQTETGESTTETTTQSGNHEIEAVDLGINDDKYTVVNNGIAIVGNRALMMYGGNLETDVQYAQIINKYKQVLGSGVNIYSMVIPTACEFYATKEIQSYTASQLENINCIIANLADDVKAVDVYTTLANHRDEDIYLRTDHHWSALGAYYAAREFAKTAGVDIPDISQYEKVTSPGYVGTMYAYSGDITIKNNPEDFSYYVPKERNYTTTYYDYVISDGEITGTQPPYEDSFFVKFPEGSSESYGTFMGGDGKLVHVHTSKANGRKLAILKDSYGNALPGYLFGSFEDIYVIDMRYFSYNLPGFVNNRGITDVLFANNVFHAATPSTIEYYEQFLTQPDSYVW